MGRLVEEGGVPLGIADLLPEQADVTSEPVGVGGSVSPDALCEPISGKN